MYSCWNVLGRGFWVLDFTLRLVFKKIIIIIIFSSDVEHTQAYLLKWHKVKRDRIGVLRFPYSDTLILIWLTVFFSHQLSNEQCASTHFSLPNLDSRCPCWTAVDAVRWDYGSCWLCIGRRITHNTFITATFREHYRTHCHWTGMLCLGSLWSQQEPWTMVKTFPYVWGSTC